MMKESIIFAVETYFLTFVIGMVIAAIIKGMQVLSRRMQKKEEAAAPVTPAAKE